jgi:hypothetical protein
VDYLRSVYLNLASGSMSGGGGFGLDSDNLNALNSVCCCDDFSDSILDAYL